MEKIDGMDVVGYQESLKKNSQTKALKKIFLNFSINLFITNLSMGI